MYNHFYAAKNKMKDNVKIAVTQQLNELQLESLRFRSFLKQAMFEAN